MILVTLFRWSCKPTYNWGGPSCMLREPFVNPSRLSFSRARGDDPLIWGATCVFPAVQWFCSLGAVGIVFPYGQLSHGTNAMVDLLWHAESYHTLHYLIYPYLSRIMIGNNRKTEYQWKPSSMMGIGRSLGPINRKGNTSYCFHHEKQMGTETTNG